MYHFEGTSKPTFEHMYKYFERGPFRAMTPFLANYILAYVVTTDETDFICRRMYRMVRGGLTPCLALILVGLHPLIQGAERPEMTGQVAFVDSIGIFPKARVCMFPPYQAPDEETVAVMRGPLLTPTRPHREALIPALRSKHRREDEGGCIVQHGINIDTANALTIEVMSFTVRNAENDDFLTLYHQHFGTSAIDHYPAMVYAFTTFTGNIDAIQDVFEFEQSKYFCLKNFAILGITHWWYDNLDNDVVDHTSYRFPAIILDENYLLQTLDLVDDLKFGSAITELIVEFSDLDQRSPRYRRCSLIFWAWAQEDTDLSSIPEAFHNDGELLQDTTMQLIAMIPSTKINTIDTLYKWETILAQTNTEDCEVARLNLIAHIVSHPGFPLRPLYLSSVGDLTPFDQVWQHFEALETNEGRLLSYDTLSIYATRILELVRQAESVEFLGLIQDSLQERFTLENPEPPVSDSDSEEE